MDYREVMRDLGAFLEDRAQWSPSIYENSVGTTIDTSRDARFRLAEDLLMEAEELFTRISSLQDGKISAAEQALDKLIDGSWRPVPDIILDEQSFLERKGIAEMADVHQFITNVVTQREK